MRGPVLTLEQKSLFRRRGSRTITLALIFQNYFLPELAPKTGFLDSQ
jgi:hypothetical protein